MTAGLDEDLEQNWLQQVRAEELLGRELTPQEIKDVATLGFNAPWLRPLVPLPPRLEDDDDEPKHDVESPDFVKSDTD